MPRRVSGNVGGAGTRAKTRQVPTTSGVIHMISRQLGESSVLSLIAGTNVNLTLSQGNTISASDAIREGEAEVAVVREAAGQLAIEYPLTLTGRMPALILSLLPNAAPPEPAPFTPANTQAQIDFNTGSQSHYVEAYNPGMLRVGVTADGSCYIGMYVGGQVKAFKNGAGVLNLADYNGALGAPELCRLSIQDRGDGKYHIYARDGADVVVNSVYDLSNLFVPGTVASITQEFFQGGTTTDIKMGVLGLANDPIQAKILTVVDGRARAVVDYFTVDAQPDTFEIQIEEADGTVIQPWADCRIVANPQAGQATVETTAALPLNKRGFALRMLIRRKREPTYVKRVTVFYPQPMVLGQGVSVYNVGYRGRRMHTNMLVNGNIQDRAEGYKQVVAGFADDTIYNEDDKGKIQGQRAGIADQNGMPLRTELVYNFHLPDASDGVEREFELTFTGDASDTFSVHVGGHGLAVTVPPARVPGQKIIRFKATIDKTQTDNGGGTFGQMRIESLNQADPPKSLFLCLRGEDKTKRFLPSFIAFLNLLPGGPLRHMNSIIANTPSLMEGAFSWANRTLRTAIGQQVLGMPLEDFVEMSNLTNRPFWWNIPANNAYGADALDYFDRSIDLLFKGTGSSVPTITGTGLAQTAYVEIGNEMWNPGLGSYFYIAQKAFDNGRYPEPPGADGNKTSDATLIERNWLQHTLMSRLEARIGAGWQDRIIRVLGGQLTFGDVPNLSTKLGWAAAIEHVDGIARAPYIPGDPNAGTSFGQPESHSVEHIIAWMRKGMNGFLKSLMDQLVEQTQKLGKAHLTYEFNLSTADIKLLPGQDVLQLREEIRAFAGAEATKTFMREEVLPWLEQFGGPVCAYEDTGNVGEGQSWNMEGITGMPWGKRWEAWTEWAANKEGATPTPTPTPYSYLKFVITAKDPSGSFAALRELYVVDGNGADIDFVTWSGANSPFHGDVTVANLNDRPRDTNEWYSSNLDEGPAFLDGVIASASTISAFGIIPRHFGANGTAPLAWRLYASASPIPADLAGATLLIDVEEAAGQWQNQTRRNFPVSA